MSDNALCITIATSIVTVALALIAWGWDATLNSTAKDRAIKIARIEACADTDNVEACLAAIR